MKYWKYIENLSIILIFIVMFLIIINVPIIAKYRNNSELIINEVVPSNKESYVTSSGESYDYIELYNGYDYDINLKDYYLSDDNFNLRKWKFPDVEIKAKSYLLVFASGLDKYDEDEIHTNFKLSSKGEVLTLSDNNTKVLSKLYYLETNPDTSYGYDGDKYVYFYNPTPLKDNSGDTSKEPIMVVEDSPIKLKISKYVLDKNPVIEITNLEDRDIDIENYYLSDNIENKYLYKLPKLVIPSSSVTIYADGLDKFEDNKIHTNFKLSSEDGTIVLSDNNKRKIDLVKVVDINTTKEIIVSEVSYDFIELKNITNNNIDLSNYEISDSSEVLIKLKGIISAGSYYVLNTSDLGIGINNVDEEISLYKNNILIDSLNVGRLITGVSSGINDLGERVYYKEKTSGKDNSNNYYLGYSSQVNFSIDGGYVDSGTSITLTTSDNSTIYYTLDGSFPSKSSTKYTGPINITKTTVIKAISYKDNYLESDIVSRTYFVGRKHDLPVVSISTNYNYFYGDSGILTNYKQNVNKMINFEYYEEDGKLGLSLVGDTKLSGMDSRERIQKSMSIYLRKDYGLKEVTYPFFRDSELKTYSSFLLRNAGEDPKHIRIMDAVLTQTLKGNMDIDIQDYRPVVVYINGNYYGLYNLREKLNEDYIVSNYEIEKGESDVVRYKTATKGSVSDYNNLVDYISTHDVTNNSVYEYIKSKIDIQELINYVITEAYYGNSDLGNIRYWKAKENGKWRFMLYDLDWSLWDVTKDFSYPINDNRVPAATYLGSVYVMTRKLYKNPEFRDLYLKTVAYHLKNTFIPSRINKITDELSEEIKNEMPYHIARWNDDIKSISSWENNLTRFKNTITSRYNYVVSNLKSYFNLSNSEYNKYFGDLDG